MHHLRLGNNEHAKLSCAPASQYKPTLYTTKVYVATELHCEPIFVYPCELVKILAMYEAPQNSSHLCTMVHNAGQWCTMQVDGAQRSSVPLKWCTMLLPKTHTNKHTVTIWIRYQIWIGRLDFI